MTLTTGYDPKSFETRIYTQWESSGVFAPAGAGPAYTILLPPPHLTGTLHMVHAFPPTLMAPLVLYHRLRGFRTLLQIVRYPAGIPPPLFVHRHLALDGTGATL